jgi:hypothetical protein
MKAELLCPECGGACEDEHGETCPACEGWGTGPAAIDDVPPVEAEDEEDEDEDEDADDDPDASEDDE